MFSASLKAAQCNTTLIVVFIKQTKERGTAMTQFTSTHTLTDHARIRSAQRGISQDQIALALDYGDVTHLQGFRFITLRAKDVPPWVDPHALGRAKNIVVVTPHDTPGLVVTVYKNKNAPKRIKRKPGRILC